MSVFHNNALIGAAGQGAAAAAGYEIQRSVRFHSTDTAYLTRAVTAGKTTFTFSVWVKRASLNGYHAIFGSGTSSTSSTSFFFDYGSGKFYAYGDGGVNHYSTELYRDFSAWYHIVVSVNNKNGTAYVNGQEVTFTPSLTFKTLYGDITIGVSGTGALYPFDGYMADFHFIDGQALAATDFGEFDDNGVWQPIEYAGTYGTDGAHLPFSDNSSASALGTDDSGNGNNFTVNNISVASGADNDSLRDSPTNGTQTDTGAGGEISGNYAVWSPISKYSTAPSPTNGNLTIPADTGYKGTYLATVALPKSGKYYWEVSSPGSSWSNIIAGVSDNVSQYYPSGGSGNELGVYFYSANLIVGTGNITAASSPTFDVGETGITYGFAADMDTGNLYLYRATIAQNSGNPIATGLDTVTTPLFPSTNSHTKQQDWNFGQRPFVAGPGTGGAAPSGYKALCTANLPDPTIADGSTAMDVKLWDGTGVSRDIAGYSFSPDLVWIKNRNGTPFHLLFDTVRGATKGLSSNSTLDEPSLTNATYLSAFNSDGFTVETASAVNATTRTYVGWCWDGGSSTAANTDGSISSSVRANPSAGFSIVTWTTVGSTGDYISVGHGLNVLPGLVITKSRSNADGWYTAHGFDLTQFGTLNTTNAFSGAGNAWGAGITSSVIGMRVGNFTANNYTHVAYCWAPVEGYSAFGSYTGNGSSDGPFVYTGHRSRWIMWKQSSASGQPWIIYDTERDPYNRAGHVLSANNANSEFDDTGYNYYGMDINSNGFKIRATDAGINASGATYIWASFAENPFKYARAR